MLTIAMVITPEDPVVPPVTPETPGNVTSRRPYSPATVVDEEEVLGENTEEEVERRAEVLAAETEEEDKGASWALLNLILAIATALASVVLIVLYFVKKKDEKVEDRKGLVRILSIAPAVGAIIAFILTENMKNPMVFVDRWTLLMVLIALMQVVVVYFSKKKYDYDDK
jgi:hypothetical protein